MDDSRAKSKKKTFWHEQARAGTGRHEQARFTGGCEAELRILPIALESPRVVMRCMIYVAGLLSLMRGNQTGNGKL
jgi:hypothetical protein